MSTNSTGDFCITNKKGERVAAKAYYLSAFRIGVFANHRDAIKALATEKAEDKNAYSCFGRTRELRDIAALIGCRTKAQEASIQELCKADTSHEDFVKKGYEHHTLSLEPAIKTSPEGVYGCLTPFISEIGFVEEFFNSSGDPLTEEETRELDHIRELDVIDGFDDELYYELKQQPCDLGIEISGNTRTIREKPLSEFVTSDKDGNTDVYKISGTSNFEILYSSKNINVVLAGDDVKPKGNRMPRDVSDSIAREYARRNGYYKQGLDAYIFHDKSKGKIVVTLKKRPPSKSLIKDKNGNKTEAMSYYFEGTPIGIFADCHDAVKEIITKAVTDKNSIYARFFAGNKYDSATIVGYRSENDVDRGFLMKNYFGVPWAFFFDGTKDICFDSNGELLAKEKVLAACEELDKEGWYDSSAELRASIGEKVPIRDLRFFYVKTNGYNFVAIVDKENRCFVPDKIYEYIEDAVTDDYSMMDGCETAEECAKQIGTSKAFSSICNFDDITSNKDAVCTEFSPFKKLYDDPLAGWEEE